MNRRHLYTQSRHNAVNEAFIRDHDNDPAKQHLVEMARKSLTRGEKIVKLMQQELNNKI